MTLQTAILALVTLFIIILLVGGLIIYIYWWLIQRAAPQLEGELTLDELDAAVEILRDKHGIPHIYAQTDADLWRAQGFVHAQERLWQMEQNRRIAHGRLAELFGAPALDVDRFSRIVGFRRAAQAELAVMDEPTLATLRQYCQGINAYIRSRPGRLAAEFNLLRRQPEEWHPVDVVAFSKMMAWNRSVNWESELIRLQIAGKLEPTLAADLEPDYPANNPVVSEGVGSAESLQMLHTAGLLLHEHAQMKGWLGHQEMGQGSNAWVVAGEKTTSGRTILCNDPHLALSMPGVWYEMRLTCSRGRPHEQAGQDTGPSAARTLDCQAERAADFAHCAKPDIDVSGASWAGVPGIIIGHNEQIAWGMTNALPDVQDLYIERPHPENVRLAGASLVDAHRDTPNDADGSGVDPAPRFEYDGKWEEATVLREEIYLRNRARPHVEEVVITRHGPLLSGLLTGFSKDFLPATPLALRWVGHQPGQLIRAILQMNRARNWQEFDAALVDWSAPAQTFVFADREGTIAYRLAGAIPLRRNGLGLVPAPGWSSDYEWRGLIPDDELPRLLNPRSGMIVTANNKITGDDYPHILSFETMPGWRARRIEEMLRQKKRLSLRDMEQIQLDQTSLYAEALTPLLTNHLSDDPYVRVAVNMLQNWGYRMDQESAAALVFHYTLLHLLDLTFGQKLGATAQAFLGGGSSPISLINGFKHRAETRLLELLQSEEDSLWYADASTGRRRTKEELIEAALQKSVHRLRREVNATPRKWAWGRMHQIRYNHLLGSAPILGWFFNRGPYPIGGDGATPNQSAFVPELPPGLAQVVASYRQIIEVGNWDVAQSVTTNGQSGHPVSRNYADQIPMWLEGAYHKMPWSRPAVEEATEFRLVLQASGDPDR